MTIMIPTYTDKTILVIGDLMLDRYLYGSTDRISPEAPVPVVHIKQSEECPGGAGNVALNLRGLGCRVILIGIIGQDEAGDSLEKTLQNAGVECHFLKLPNQQTITKLRVFGRNQQLIRLDFEQPFTNLDSEEWYDLCSSHLSQADAIIFSDYGKGITAHMGKLIAAAKQLGKPTFVDPKNSDFSFYQSATVITPNLKEFEAAVGKCQNETEMASKAQDLMAKHDFDALLVTRGEDGMSLFRPDHSAVHLKAHASEVYDVSGAGDTVISVLTATAAADQNLQGACILANLAAGIVVRKLGVTAISLPELRRRLNESHGREQGILSESELSQAIADARAHGETVVMTNGCFDILHAGHIVYLEEASRLGDRLIIAVNSDESVAQLKGPSRPINSLQQRMSLLSALRCVDWVVPFSEETPERLISHLLPDILVKGGDYQVHEIAGSKQVLACGGDVKILSFVPGHSTSGTIEKILKGEEECT